MYRLWHKYFELRGISTCYHAFDFLRCWKNPLCFILRQVVREQVNNCQLLFWPVEKLWRTPSPKDISQQWGSHRIWFWTEGIGIWGGGGNLQCPIHNFRSSEPNFQENYFAAFEKGAKHLWFPVWQNLWFLWMSPTFDLSQPSQTSPFALWLVTSPLMDATSPHGGHFSSPPGGCARRQRSAWPFVAK